MVANYSHIRNFPLIKNSHMKQTPVWRQLIICKHFYQQLYWLFESIYSTSKGNIYKSIQRNKSRNSIFHEVTQKNLSLTISIISKCFPVSDVLLSHHFVGLQVIVIINIEFRSFQYIDLLLDRRHLNSDIVKFALLYVVTLLLVYKLLGLNK